MLDQAKNEYVDCYTKKEMSAKSHICFLRGCPIYFCRIRKFMLALHSFRKNTKINKKGVMSAKSVEWRWLVVLGKVYGIVTCWVISISHSHTRRFKFKTTLSMFTFCFAYAYYDDSKTSTNAQCKKLSILHSTSSSYFQATVEQGSQKWLHSSLLKLFIH